MSKRITQSNTVVVPAHAVSAHEAAAAIAAKQAATPADAAAKAEIVAEKGEKAVPAETVIAAVAPLAMVQTDPATGAATTPQDTTGQTTTTTTDATATTTADTSTSGDASTDYTPYIVGGVLLAGGVLAVALSGGDDNDSNTPTPAPTPTPTPTPAANTAPTFAAPTATASVAENQAASTTVFTARATDAQNNTIAYSLGGTDAGLFNINGSTGVVTLKSSANFEAKSSYTFTVTAADNATPSLNSSQTVTLSVTDVNESPTFATGTRAVTVAENFGTTQALFTATATDPDASTGANGRVTYTLEGGDASAFAINAMTGAVTFRAAPDFETKATYAFNVVASDAGTDAGRATQAVTVNLTDVNEAPVFTIDGPRTTTIDENVAAGTTVVTAGATDVDRGDTITYSLTGTDAGAFAVNGQTGVVTFVNSPDFETKSSYSFNLVATDRAGLTDTQANTVNINDLPDLRVVAIDGAGSVASYNAADGAVRFNESAGASNTTAITGFGRDDTIVVSGAGAGAQYNFQSNGADLIISFAAGTSVSPINTVITLQGAVAANAFVFDEASAERAVGADFFRYA